MSATLQPTPISVYLDEHFTRYRHPTYQPQYKLALLSVIDINPEDTKGHLSEIFSSLNVGEPLKDLAKEWQAKRERSLSVCDVIVIGETAFRCEPTGWSVMDPSIIAAHTLPKGE